MTSKMLLHKTPLQQVPRTCFAGRPQVRPVPLGQRVVVHAEEGEGGEKEKVAKSGGESKPAPAKKKAGGGGKDKFVSQYKSGANRDKQNIMLASEQSLSYLDGSLPADYGFDPLGLMDPEGAGDEGFISPPWLVYGEVYNGRWAMLGIVGALFPEALALGGVIPQSPEEMTWFRCGIYPPAGTRTYWTDPYTLFYLEMWFFNIVELRRLRDYKNPGSMGKQYFLGAEKGLAGTGDPTYPGGLFNPLQLCKDNPDGFHTYKTRECKNGRLAMIAMLGISAQGTLTNEGPVTNLVKHALDPYNNNIYTTLTKLYEPLA